MVKYLPIYLNLSIFTVFLKNKNIIFKIRRSKVTDYAALMQVKSIAECSRHSAILSTFIKLPFVIKIFVLSIFEWLIKQVLLYFFSF